MDHIKGEIQLCISKIVNITILHCSLLSTEHPILCGTSLFLLLVYVFLPSLFYFLLYSFPIVVIITVAVKFAIDHRPCNKKNIKQEEQISTQTTTTPALQARTKSFNRAHSVRRRREQQSKVEEKDMVSSMQGASDILVDKAALIEDNPKDIQEVKVDDNANNNRIEGSPAVVSERVVKNEKKGSFKGGYHDGRSSDEDQEEEKKALEWTEDDQRNLTDLGLSEIERNKRLESLIAKRMARKLLSIQVRKTLMNMGNNKHPHISSILVPKANSDSQISPVPGSAPSVLLPNRNPFDLPYDSHEEKPNLTGDGLPEELVTNQPPKDLMFCRHVSFSQGVHFPCPEEFDKDRPAPFNFADKQSIRSIPEFSRLRKEPENKRDPNLSPKKASSRTGEGLLYTNKRVIHTPRNSIDSDMLVEMSETASQLDSASLGLEDDLGIAKPWAASSHLAGVEENESRSREVHEVSEKDVIAVGFARLNPICDDHVSLNEMIDEPEPGLVAEPPGLVAEPPALYPNDDRLVEASGSHSTHNNNINIIEEPGDQEQEKSSPTTTEKNIMNDVPANDNDILDFIKQTYGEGNSNGQRSAPSDENHMIAAPNDENQTNAAPSDENHTNVSSEDIIEDRHNELIDQNGHNQIAGLSDLIVHRNTDHTNDQQPIIESKERQETMIEGGPSDSSSSSTPESPSTMKGETGQFDANEGNSETVAYAGPLDSDDEAGPSNAVQETDTGPPFGSSSLSPKSVLQKKFSMASISSSDQINMETPQPEQQNEDVISVSPSSQHDIQTIQHEPSTHIETRQIPLEETMSSSTADPESVIIGPTQTQTVDGLKNEGEGSHNETVKLDDNEERNQEATESVEVDKDKSKETSEVKPVEELTYKNEDVNVINGS
ncbi:uncharacterized protein LOC124915287 [Impatiens glandulifera]|uniref:uncharacterized protein LOC124915287 n=1 Tax=Impatiens glandulifera TaxID=253017 RepID=UPI001FB0766D|nr:uncharacterized protein LOC124915287 [Impatiens glandulifera]